MKVQRLRVKFSKTSAMRYTGHLDVRRAWERAMRRADLPLAYSKGFSPHPQMNLASPLPLGFTSTAELADFWFYETVDPHQVLENLARVLPPGLEIHHVEEINDLHADKLPNLVQSSRYEISFPEQVPNLVKRVNGLLERDEIPRERKKKAYDLRPLIENLVVLPPIETARTRLQVQLSSRPGANGRPDEVLKALDLSPYDALICRTEIILEESRDGSSREG